MGLAGLTILRNVLVPSYEMVVPTSTTQFRKVCRSKNSNGRSIAPVKWRTIALVNHYIKILYRPPVSTDAPTQVASSPSSLPSFERFLPSSWVTTTITTTTSTTFFLLLLVVPDVHVRVEGPAVFHLPSLFLPSLSFSPTLPPSLPTYLPTYLPIFTLYGVCGPFTGCERSRLCACRCHAC